MFAGLDRKNANQRGIEFYQLLDYFKTDFGSLSREKPRSPHVNHCVLFIIRPQVHRQPRTEWGFDPQPNDSYIRLNPPDYFPWITVPILSQYFISTPPENTRKPGGTELEQWLKSWLKHNFDSYWKIAIKKYPRIKSRGHNSSQPRPNRADFKEKVPPQSPTALSDLIDWPCDKTIIRSHPEMFFENGVLKNLAKFTGKHLAWCLFLITLQVFRF